jgi:hypothetical protein
LGSDRECKGNRLTYDLEVERAHRGQTRNAKGTGRRTDWKWREHIRVKPGMQREQVDVQSGSGESTSGSDRECKGNRSTYDLEVERAHRGQTRNAKGTGRRTICKWREHIRVKPGMQREQVDVRTESGESTSWSNRECKCKGNRSAYCLEVERVHRGQTGNAKGTGRRTDWMWREHIGVRSCT